MLSLFLTTLVFMLISMALMITQNRIILSQNDKINSAFKQESSDALFDAMGGYAKDLGQSCINVVEKNFDECEKLGKSTAYFAEMLYTDYYKDDVDISYGVGFAEGKTPEAIAEIDDISDLREYISTNSDYDEDKLDALDIFVVTEKGLVIDGTNNNYGESYEDLRKEKWYVDCKKTMAPLWTDVIHGTVTGKEKIDYVHPIIVNGEFKGISVVSMEINTLCDSLLRSNFRTIKETDLLDSEGNKITGGADYDKAAEKFDLQTADEIYMDGNNCWISFLLPEKKFTVCFEFQLDELYETVNAYSRGFETNNNIIRRHTGKLLIVMMVIYIVICLPLLLLFVIISGRIGRSVVNPLMSLGKKVENFGKGNLDIDISDITTDDEVGLLAHTIYEMSENTKKYLEEIKEITAEQEKVNAEMETAAKIQLSLMSADFPKDSFCDVYARMMPAKFVGGDVYATFDIDENNVLVFVGDVAGKGLPASFISVRTKINIQIYGEMNLGPAETLRQINNRLCHNNDETIFVTAFLAVFNKATGVLTYANAGHNKPILADEEPHFIDMNVGLPLGCIEDMKYKDETITLKKGESVFIYSDGVPEAMGADNTFYSNERFLKLVSEVTAGEYTAKSLVDAVDDDLKRHYGGKELWDDITMLVLKYTGGEG